MRVPNSEFEQAAPDPQLTRQDPKYWNSQNPEPKLASPDALLNSMGSSESRGDPQGEQEDTEGGPETPEAEPGVVKGEPVASYVTMTLFPTSPDPRISNVYSLLDALMFVKGFNLRGVPVGAAAFVPSKNHEPAEEESPSQLDSPEEPEKRFESPQAQKLRQEQIEPMDDAIHLHPDEEDDVEADLDPTTPTM